MIHIFVEEITVPIYIFCVLGMRAMIVCGSSLQYNKLVVWDLTETVCGSCNRSFKRIIKLLQFTQHCPVFKYKHAQLCQFNVDVLLGLLCTRL